MERKREKERERERERGRQTDRQIDRQIYIRMVTGRHINVFFTKALKIEFS